MEAVGVSFGYPGGELVLRGSSVSVGRGERVVLLGRNGSGKSTLGRLLNGSLTPVSGQVRVDEKNVGLARLVGYVRQDPRNQIVSSLVSDEVAFGPRNIGLSCEEVLTRVEEALSLCGISDLRDRMTTELSGGQQQLLAIAGVVAMHPRYLVLDEVGSHLDDAARRRVRDLVDGLVVRGMGVLDIAHSAEALFGADRVVVLASGEVAWQGGPQEFLRAPEALAASGLDLDPVARLLADAASRGYVLADHPDPEVLARYVDLPGVPVPSAAPTGHELACSGVTLSYDDVRALDGVSLRARGLTLLLGRSGSGKTTLARILAGVLEPDSGAAKLDGRAVRAGDVGLAFQRPEDQLFCDTVLDDIAYGPRARGLGEKDALSAARGAAELLAVGEDLLGRSPFELSGGQMRRAALAGVIACGRGAYVLDEPTAGLDAASREELRALVRDLVARGASVLVVTHDAGEWLGMASRIVFLCEGRVVCEVGPERAAADPAPYEEAGLEPPLVVRLRAARGGGADARR